MPDRDPHAGVTDTEPWRSYRHAAVRDLVWLIASTPLLPDPLVAVVPDQKAFWPDAAVYQALYSRHEPWLRRLDAEPQPLMTFLARTRDYRLGRYAEDLLHFWLAAPDNPEFRLIASHVALRDNGITLGEPDFLVRERDSGKLWHIELALKFYLGTVDQQWLGPNRQDSLARKLHHLCQHQLPLLHSPAGQAWLQTQHLDTPAPWAWLKGRLFSPFASALPRPAGTEQPPCWFSPRELRDFAAHHDYQWFTLGKSHWLAPGGSTAEQHLPFCLDAGLRELPATGAQALLACQGGQERLRAFVVGENWSRAPISSR